MTAEAVREVAQLDNAFIELDAVCDELTNQFTLLPGYRPRPLPPELCHVTGMYGVKELVMKSTAFAAYGIALGRIALIRGEGIWIGNIVVYPADGFTTPILGMELLVFRERMHLLVADLFPMIDDDEALMDDITPRFDHLGCDPEIRTEPRNIFSRSPIFRKHGDTAMLGVAAQAMREVSQRWFVKAFSAKPDPNTEIAERAATKRANYISSHLADEPADPFLKRAFGDEIGGRLVNEILFPTLQWNSVTSNDSGELNS